MAPAAAVAEVAKEEFTEAELDAAAILCGLKDTLRARDRRLAQRLREIPSWGRRRPRSMPEDKPAAACGAAPPASRDGAASPDTPLAYPESGGDDAPAEAEGAHKAAEHEQRVLEQHGVVAQARLSQENAHLLKVTKREQEHELEEQARKKPRVAADPQAAAAALGIALDLNEPAPRAAPEEDEQARARAQAQAQAQAAAAAAAAAVEWYRQAHLRAAMQKAAVSAGARRRRLQILRAKPACPLVSSRPRR